jgi:hypothetical protein
MGFPAGGTMMAGSGGFIEEPPSQADIEAMIQATGMPIKRILQRVIPAVQSQTVGEMQISIASLEIYDGAFTAHVRVRNFRERTPSSRMSDMLGMPRLNFEASDDLGGTYTGMQGGGGGSDNEWKSEIDFSPALHPDARTPTLSVTEIHWFAFGPGQQSRVEPGPWRFQMPLT